MTHNRKKIQFIALVLLFFITLSIWVAVFFLNNRKTDILTVTFLDVGQGDAIFIEAPNGTQVLLDGGPDKSVLRELGKTMAFFDRSLDMVIMSHPDLDHIGGLPAVLERFNVTHLMTPGVSTDTGAYEAVFKVATEKGVEPIIAEPLRIWLDKEHGVYLDVLFPDRNVSGLEANMASVVAKLTYGEATFLFTGDSPKNIEEYLVDVGKENLDVDVLKLGHHGSKTSTGEEFLGYTSPEYAVISSGKDNTYGHPHQEVTDMLKNFGIPFLNTAEVGRIVFESDGGEPVKK